MAYPAVKLLVLLVSCLTVLGAELDTLSWPDPGPQLLARPTAQPPTTQGPIIKSRPPSQEPVNSQSPSQSPVQSHPPSQAPVQSPAPSLAPVQPRAPSRLPKRSFVAVQGVVYCKPCELSGIDSLQNATPLEGAVVKLQCNNTKYTQTEEAKTNKKGYFLLAGPKTLTTYGSHKCKVRLGSSPQPKCTKPTNLKDGLHGALLMAQNKTNLPPPIPYQLFTVGPFAFEPATKCAH